MIHNTCLCQPCTWAVLSLGIPCCEIVTYFSIHFVHKISTVSDTTMSTTVKDLPKDLLIADGLKGELLKEHNLKPTESTEKNLLPSAEDVQQEKTHLNFLSGRFISWQKTINQETPIKALLVSTQILWNQQKLWKRLSFLEKMISRLKRQYRMSCRYQEILINIGVTFFSSHREFQNLKVKTWKQWKQENHLHPQRLCRFDYCL